MNKPRWYLLVLFVIIISLPYLIAEFNAPPSHQFGGSLLNPGDGYTYQAKMYQGWEGSWRFILPYTSEAGGGAYLYLYYIFLGHLARWLNIPILVVYHLARLIASILLYFALVRFIKISIENEPWSMLALALALFGSGIGWLLVPFGIFPSDLWVADGYPFLTAYVNAHFPLGLAIILWLLSVLDQKLTWKSALTAFLAGILLANIQSFGVVIVSVIWAGKIAWDWWETKQFSLGRFAIFIISSAPILLYQFWVLNSDPVMKGWNTQNQTPSPPLWDLIISFSPALLLAFYGGYKLLKNNPGPKKVLIIWAVLGLILLYLPFNLQRRFILGLYIPIAVLAVIGVIELVRLYPSRKKWLKTALILLSLPSTLIVLVAGGFGIMVHSPIIYLAAAENRALTWITTNTTARALFLASPDTGLLIPARTGRRVIYGHMYETVNAEQEKQTVEDFFSGRLTVQESLDLLAKRKVDYIFYGPREHELGTPPVLENLCLAYQTDDVQIFSVNAIP